MKDLRNMIRNLLKESISLDVKPGDVILTGRFKNKRKVVKSIGTDKFGQPTINGKSILKFKIEKNMPKKKWSAQSRAELKEVRKVVKNILIETRANLAIRPVMKKWVEVAADHGDIANSEYIRLQPSGSLEELAGIVAALRVPENKSHLVFEGLTEETQEWVLKHWKTEEYFSNMISGVVLSIVKEYIGRPTALGMKTGSTSISAGTWSAENKTWVGGMTGFISMKSWNKDGFTSDFFDGAKKSDFSLSNLDTVPMDRQAWKKWCIKDLKQGDSVLFHEFQHWFQESVMYADKRLKSPTKGTNGRSEGKYSTPKGFTSTRNPVSRISLMLLKQTLDGIDWLNPQMHPTLNCPMYEITDQDALVSQLLTPSRKSFNRIDLDSLYAEKYISVGHKRIDDGGWLEKFITDTIKMPITSDQMQSLTSFYGKIRILLLTFAKSSSRENSISKSIKAAFSTVECLFVPTSHIKKSTSATTKEIKDNKYPITLTNKNKDKDYTYAIFVKPKEWSRQDYGKNDQGYKVNMGGKKSWDFERAKNPIARESNTQPWNLPWEQRWEEFDAESRNYLSLATQQQFDNHEFLRSLLKSDNTECSDLLYQKLVRLLEPRFDRKLVKAFDEELKTLASRVADKAIEEVELNDIFEYKDNPPSGFQGIRNQLTEEALENYVNGTSLAFFGDYFEYIEQRVFGEV